MESSYRLAKRDKAKAILGCASIPGIVAMDGSRRSIDSLKTSSPCRENPTLGLDDSGKVN